MFMCKGDGYYCSNRVVITTFLTQKILPYADAIVTRGHVLSKSEYFCELRSACTKCDKNTKGKA
jgi:hypothetical protein